MTTLTELKKLAEETPVACFVPIEPQQVLKMIECMEQMAEALESCSGEYELSFDQHLVEDSLTAFNKLNLEE